MKKFKNISGIELTIPDIGIVKAGEVVELPEDFNNANFEPVEGRKKEEKKEEDEEIKN